MQKELTILLKDAIDSAAAVKDEGVSFIVMPDGTLKEASQMTANDWAQFPEEKEDEDEDEDEEPVENFSWFTANLSSYQTRLTKFEGRDHLIVPVVLLTEGVHNGSDGPLFYSSEELSKFVASWNGVPVPVYHPQEGGQPVSCNSPEVLESQNVGRLFKAQYDKGKLKAQLWLDVLRLQEVDPALLVKLNAKELVEVSTGFFSDQVNEPGEWNGEKYDAKVVNIRPDHLALLPTGQGACSSADGCGIRANQAPADFQKLWERLVTMAQPSFGDISRAISIKLDSMEIRPDPLRPQLQKTWHYLEEVYPDYFIYEKESSGERQFFKQSYTYNKTGKTVEFTGAPVAVKKETKFVPITDNQGGISVDKKEKIKFLTDNGCQCQAAQLETLEEGFLDGMVKTVENTIKANADLAAAQKNSETLTAEVKTLKETKPVDNKAPATVDEYVANAPAEMQSVLNRALARDRQMKADLVEMLATNQKAFTKEELAAKPLDELEKLAALASPQGDFSLKNLSAQTPTQIKEEPLAVPTFNFEKK